MAGQSKSARGQPVSRAKTEFSKLCQAYHSGDISAKKYLDKTDSLTEKLLSEGAHFKNEELVSLLNLYQKIAWSKDEFSYARAGYYLIFLNNARMFDQAGVSKYYEQRAFLVMIISIIASLSVLSVYLIMGYRSKKAKMQIDVLNNAVNMQIIAMEETRHQAVRAEQQRLGQDLHDGFSSSIAAIRHQLETLSMETDDIPLKNKLALLQEETAHIYESARRKSHEWFSAADKQHELPFEKQIRLLVNSALPGGRYNKTIHIDSDALQNVSTDIRVGLLRIIQEVITNIIKHAKAKNVDILIYEEMGSLILTVNDDGIGFGEKKPCDGKSTMGLGSINRRVQYLNGETKINSDKKGTEVTVSIPLNFTV